MRNRENGGKCNLAFNVAKIEARMTKGATILNIFREHRLSLPVLARGRGGLGQTHQQRRHRKGTKYWYQSVDRIQVERPKNPPGWLSTDAGKSKE